MEVFDDKQNVFESLYKQWRKAIRHRNKLWKKFTHQRTDANYAEYKKQRNKCTSIRRKAIKDQRSFLKQVRDRQSTLVLGGLSSFYAFEVK